jgi:uroporphyrinogen-III synthase
MTRIVVIRPAVGSFATVRVAGRRGVAVEPFPMAEVQPEAWQAPDPAGVDALLVGSANVFRHAGPQIDAFRTKPVLAVGMATAQMAENAGFAVGLAGEGGLQHLIDRLPPDEEVRLLRLAARDHVTINLPPRVTVDTRVVYAAHNVPMPDALAALLEAEGALVLLHSAGLAAHFASEVERLGIDRGKVRLAALGPRIAEAAGAGWASLRWADRPAESDLLALAEDMCH